MPVCLEHKGTGCRIRFAKCRVAVDQSASVEAMPCAQHGDRCQLDRSTCRARGHDCGCRLADHDLFWAIRVVPFDEDEPINYLEIERRIADDQARERAAYDRIHSAPGIPNDRHWKRLVDPGSVAAQIDAQILEDEKLIEEAKAKSRERDRQTVPSEFLAQLTETNPAALVAIEADPREPVEVVTELQAQALASDRSLMSLVHELARRYFLAHPERHPETKPDPVKVLAQIRRQPDLSLAVDWEAEQTGQTPVEVVSSETDHLAILTRWRRRDRAKDDESARRPSPVIPLRPRPSPVGHDAHVARLRANQPRTLFT
jgi:hypothetical protein